MRQAIEEGFILDVLQNYVSYKRFFGLVKQIEDERILIGNNLGKINGWIAATDVLGKVIAVEY